VQASFPPEGNLLVRQSATPPARFCDTLVGKLQANPHQLVDKRIEL
jgi:hypothetical protein